MDRMVFYIDTESSWSMHQIYIEEGVTESIAEPRFYEQKADSVNGTYRQPYDTYDEVSYSVTCYFKAENHNWKAKLRKIKAWLFSFNDGNEHKLQFSDDLEWFKKLSKVEIDDCEYIGKDVGKFKITFTCEPFDYSIEGQYEHELSAVTYNMWSMCEPVYIIKMLDFEKNQTLRINGNGFTIYPQDFTRSDTIYLDVNLGFCHFEDGNMVNRTYFTIKDDARLEHGLNTITATSGLEVKVIPNWRCI